MNLRRKQFLIFWIFALSLNSVSHAGIFEICSSVLSKIFPKFAKKNDSPIHRLADPDRVIVKSLPILDSKKPITAENFEASNYGISSGHEHNQDFLVRAVLISNEVIDALNSGSNMESAYQVAIDGRQLIGNGFTPGVYYRDKGRAPFDHLATTSKDVLDIPYRLNLFGHIDAIHKLRKGDENIYTHMNGEKTKLASVGLLSVSKNKSDLTYVRSCRALEDIMGAFKDVFARLDRAAKSTSIEEKIDDYSRAVYGLANTSPLYRGNSSVARFFLTASAYKIFGKNLKLYADITLESMYREEDQFLSMFKPRLREALHSTK